MDKQGKKTTAKKSSGTTKRRAGAGKSPARKDKRTGGSASKSVVKKGKVSLSATKVIWLCLGVIAICLALLLVTSIGEKQSERQNAVEITKRFDETEKKEDINLKNDDKPKKQNEKPPVQDSRTEENKSINLSTAGKNKISEVEKNDKPASSVKNVEPPKKVEQNTNKNTINSSFNFSPAVNHAELIFVFDDGGQNLNQLQPFLELPIPITVAVLPKLAHSAETAARVRKSGNEVMLHQPMQAINSSVDPGPGAIKPEMTVLEINELVQSNIEEIAPIAGMNNHEGSLITADAAKIGVVLDVADKNGIFFLDSRTNVETKVPEVSRRAGYSWYERNGRFLDNEKTREEFLTELRKNLDIANKSGSVIMIGHIWSADYLPALIREVYPELKEKGYVFTTVSKSNAKKK